MVFVALLRIWNSHCTKPSVSFDRESTRFHSPIFSQKCFAKGQKMKRCQEFSHSLPHVTHEIGTVICFFWRLSLFGRTSLDVRHRKVFTLARYLISITSATLLGSYGHRSQNESLEQFYIPSVRNISHCSHDAICICLLPYTYFMTFSHSPSDLSIDNNPWVPQASPNEARILAEWSFQEARVREILRFLGPWPWETLV